MDLSTFPDEEEEEGEGGQEWESGCILLKDLA
jgi:hypothetical protein